MDSAKNTTAAVARARGLVRCTAPSGIADDERVRQRSERFLYPASQPASESVSQSGEAATRAQSPHGLVVVYLLLLAGTPEVTRARRYKRSLLSTLCVHCLRQSLPWCISKSEINHIPRYCVLLGFRATNFATPAVLLSRCRDYLRW